MIQISLKVEVSFKNLGNIPVKTVKNLATIVIKHLQELRKKEQILLWHWCLKTQKQLLPHRSCFSFLTKRVKIRILENRIGKGLM